jgi:hypothetical protein
MLSQQGRASEGRVVGKSFFHTLLNSSYSSDIFAILIVDQLLVYMQDFYRLFGGFKEKAEQVQETVCKKLLVLDMH